MRRPLGYLAAAILGGLAVTLFGAGPQQKPAASNPGLVEATRLVPRSPDGSARMILSGDDGGLSIRMLGPDAEDRMTVALVGRAGIARAAPGGRASASASRPTMPLWLDC